MLYCRTSRSVLQGNENMLLQASLFCSSLCQTPFTSLNHRAQQTSKQFTKELQSIALIPVFTEKETEAERSEVTWQVPAAELLQRQAGSRSLGSSRVSGRVV